MSVKLRLARAGAKKKPFYHIVAIDSHNKRDGVCLERLGTYNPNQTPYVFTINAERAAYWIKNGAQPTETVAALIKKNSAAVAK